jgi:hypothetical protein
MTRQRTARALTLLAMAAALALVVFRNTGRSLAEATAAAVQPKADPTPQEAIYAMLDAARDGDVAAYLNAYTGQMASSLRQSIAEQGEPAFRQYLLNANAPIKGIALADPQPLTDAEVRVRVEFVYADRNEAQLLYLEKQPDKTWKIARLDSAERIKTLVPYGTPVQ